jgi:hypothetical protein
MAERAIGMEVTNKGKADASPDDDLTSTTSPSPPDAVVLKNGMIRGAQIVSISNCT